MRGRVRSTHHTSCVVLDGNPADATLAVEMVERHREVFGQPPRQVAFDGGFASRANLTEIKGHGVEDVSFSKGRGLAISEMAKSTWVYRRLRNFRAGIEGGISFLKRAFGLRRCTWSGLASFKSYVWSSVIAANALVPESPPPLGMSPSHAIPSHPQLRRSATSAHRTARRRVHAPTFRAADKRKAETRRRPDPNASLAPGRVAGRTAEVAVLTR